MKRAYTIFQNDVVTSMRKAEVGKVCAFAKEQYDAAVICETQEEWLNSYSYHMMAALALKLGVHLFMPGIEFCEWLVECNPIVKSDHLKVVADLLCEYPGECGVLHFPTSNHLPSVLFSINGIRSSKENLDNSVVTMVFSKESGLRRTGVFADMKDYPLHEKETWFARLISGLGLYWNCFPETIKDGIPEDLQHPAYHANKSNRTISVSSKIFGGDHASPTAHFRKGHFRCLRSERYKNKRFQVVFVHETFVGGKAKTTIPPEEVKC